MECGLFSTECGALLIGHRAVMGESGACVIRYCAVIVHSFCDKILCCYGTVSSSFYR